MNSSKNIEITTQSGFKKLKKTYQLPSINHIKMDNEISLQLESAIEPPIGPGEANTNQNITVKDPYNTMV